MNRPVSAVLSSVSAVIDTIGVPVFAEDGEGNLLCLNKAFSRLQGYALADIPTRAAWWFRACPNPAYRDWAVAEWSRRLAATQAQDAPFDPLCVQVVTGDGETRQMMVTASLLEQEGARLTVTTFSDMTEQFRAGQALEASNRQLDFALAGSGLGLWDCDLVSGQVTYDARWCAILGYEPHEIGLDLHAWQQLIHPDDRALVDRAVQSHLQGDTAIYQTEHRLRHKEGHWVWVLARGKVVVRDAQGCPLRATGTQQDISSQKRLSHEGLDLLRQMETLLKSISGAGSLGAAGIDESTSASFAGGCLTKRQQEILTWVAQGKRSAEIAGILNIAKSTVATHRRDMMKKLGVRNAAALAKFASAIPKK